MNFTATLAHGYGVCLFLSPETISHGSDFCTDMICRTIQMVYDAFGAKYQGHGGMEDEDESYLQRFPRHLCIQSDNPVSQAKNTWFTLFLAWLVSAGLFESATLNFLRVGHTHEDIDQFFSLIVSLILKCHDYETPDELLVFLETELRPKFSGRGECVLTRTVTGIYDWSSWLTGLGRSMTGCFQNRAGAEAPHSLTFKMWESLRPYEWRGFQGHQGHGDTGARGSVYCLVKNFMSSTALTQAPVCVLPADRRPHTAWPVALCPRVPLAETVVYVKLIEGCRSCGLPRAATALERLLFDHSFDLPALSWMADARMRFRWTSTVAQVNAVRNPYFPHLPDMFKMVAHNRAPKQKKRRGGEVVEDEEEG
jgi:hypothetical protein